MPEALRKFGSIKPGQSIGQWVGGDPEIEADHFYICPECNQPVDKRDLGEVLHHEVKGHRPLPRRHPSHRATRKLRHFGNLR